jgi:hypothetical protein
MWLSELPLKIDLQETCFKQKNNGKVPNASLN